jgi:hypothetical protein
MTNALNKKLNTNRLDRLSSVRLEMARVYRKARNSKLDLDRAKSLIWMLAQIRGVIEAEIDERKTDELAARIAALEAATR